MFLGGEKKPWSGIPGFSGQLKAAFAGAGVPGHKVFNYGEGDYFCTINYLL
jgi:hypothetical protein